MSKTIEAIFDGKVLRPKDALTLEPNTRVRITIEPIEQTTKDAVSFLDTALSLKLDGPPDWVVNIVT
jgi:predicted DNA-binding antitoxin AbrB/MazE fold protein